MNGTVSFPMTGSGAELPNQGNAASAHPPAIMYTALMKHNAETIEKLVLMQYNTFQIRRKIVSILLSIAMILYGVFTFHTGMITSYFCLFLGCVMIAGLNVRAKSNARKILAQLSGKYPSSEYYFSEAGFRDSKKSGEIPYSNLIWLIDDRKYLYLYITKESAYMVNNSSVYGEGGLDGLKELLSEKSGQKWSSPSTFWNFNINSLRELLGSRSSGFEGERLNDHHRF